MKSEITEALLESAKKRLVGLEKESEFLDRQFLEFGHEEDFDRLLEVERMIGEGYSLVAYYTQL